MRLWRNNPETPEGKYLVQRVDEAGLRGVWLLIPERLRDRAGEDVKFTDVGRLYVAGVDPDVFDVVAVQRPREDQGA